MPWFGMKQFKVLMYLCFCFIVCFQYVEDDLILMFFVFLDVGVASVPLLRAAAME